MSALVNDPIVEFARRTHPPVPEGREISISLKNCSLSFGDVHVLRSVSLDIYKNEVVSILGPSGCGKSTLLKAMFGLVRVHSGQVTLHGKDITNLKANRLVETGVGFVPQTNNVFPSLTVEENLRLSVRSRRSWPTERDTIVETFPQLADRLKVPAGALSPEASSRCSRSDGLSCSTPRSC